MTTTSAGDEASAAAAAAEAERLEREGVSYNMCDKQSYKLIRPRHYCGVRESMSFHLLRTYELL